MMTMLPMWSVVVKRGRCWLWLIIVAAALAGCRRTDDVVKIGLVAPFEGADRAIGYDVIYSARLAVREVNAAGGIDGRRIALVALDDGSDADLAHEVALSLVLDPGVVAVIGHYTPQASAAGEAIYDANTLPFLHMGAPPFVPFTPEALPADFQARYAAVTPFDEQAGPYAASTYDAMQLLFAAMNQAAAEKGEVSRQALSEILHKVRYSGITGTVYQTQ